MCFIPLLNRSILLPNMTLKVKVTSVKRIYCAEVHNRGGTNAQILLKMAEPIQTRRQHGVHPKWSRITNNETSASWSKLFSMCAHTYCIILERLWFGWKYPWAGIMYTFIQCISLRGYKNSANSQNYVII